MKASRKQRLLDLWSSGDELRVGQELYDGIPNERRPAWAAAILRFAIELAGLDLEPVNRVEEIALDPARWAEAHRAFGAVRALTLSAERESTSNTEVALLFVAEIAAKVTYNASGAPAPFDEDSGARMAKNLRHFAFVCDAASEEEAWALMADPRWRTSVAR